MVDNHHSEWAAASAVAASWGERGCDGLRRAPLRRPAARRLGRGAGRRPAPCETKVDWQSDMGVEPTQDGITAPQTSLEVCSPAHGCNSTLQKYICSLMDPSRCRWLVGRLSAAEGIAQAARADHRRRSTGAAAPSWAAGPIVRRLPYETCVEDGERDLERPDDTPPHPEHNALATDRRRCAL